MASISAGNDEDVGEMIACAVDKVGADGVLSIESSSSFETTIEVEEGMEVRTLPTTRLKPQIHLLTFGFSWLLSD